MVLLLFIAASLRADGAGVVRWDMRSTAYGDGIGCCWGGISRDGVTWERFDWRSTACLAAYAIPRGTEVCLFVPAQPDAAGDHLRYSPVFLCTDPDTGGALTIADSCWIGPGVPCARDHLDISHGMIRWLGFCGDEEEAGVCLRRWGNHRRVGLYVWGGHGS